MKLSLCLKDLMVNQIMNKLEEIIMFEFVTWGVWFIEFLRAKCNYYMRESKMIRGLERRWSMLALIRENLVFSW